MEERPGAGCGSGAGTRRAHSGATLNPVSNVGWETLCNRVCFTFLPPPQEVCIYLIHISQLFVNFAGEKINLRLCSNLGALLAGVLK